MQHGQAQALNRSHIAPVRSREELIYLLSRACELEHSVACVYLFAAYSLKTHPDEGGLSAAQAEMVKRWKRRLVAVSVEEMLHLTQLSNVLTAIGGAPHFRRTNFPVPRSAIPIDDHMTLEPFSLETMERLMCVEMPEPGVLPPEEQAAADEVLARVTARRGSRRSPGLAVADKLALEGCEPFDIDFKTQGEFYHKIMSGFDCIPETELFIGPPEAQANARFVHFADKLLPVHDRASARAALQMVIEQGESPSKAHPDAHFWVFRAIHAEYLQAIEEAKKSGAVFDPVRPVVTNPMTRFYDDTTGGTPISNPLTHQVAELFNVSYDTMLLMLLRFFAHTDESADELRKISLASLHLMTNVLRPLGEALTKMPAGHGRRLAGRTAGPGFGYNRDIHLLPHKRSAWVFFGERLRELATVVTGIIASQTGRLPVEVEEAAAGLQALSLQFAPADKTWNAVAEFGEFRAIEAAQQRAIKPSRNGPLLVTNVERFIGSDGQPLHTSPEMALCRCGGSKNKPFCDGTHARIGFSSTVDANDSDRTPDQSRDYRGAEITVHFNRLQCSASEQCHKNLSTVFRVGERPWIQVDRDKVERVIEIVTRCPSGALRYTRNGELGPKRKDPAGIRIRKNGPYEVEGDIPLRTDHWSDGAMHDHYALCRCGASKNKPFCDGSHWKAGFNDDDS